MAKPAAERRPTIIDVAQAAGVSVSTVSRVLRKHADVRAETRALVQEAIDRLGYRPSALARAMVSGETKLLALLVSDIANPFYPQLAKSVEQEAKRKGYAVVICNTGDLPAETRRYTERLLRQGLDGVIHASAARDEKVLLSLVGDANRIVFTNRRPSEESVSYVVSDNRAGAEHLTRHLLTKGHRRIGFIAGPDWARNAAERLSGFQQAIAGVHDVETQIAAGPFSAEHGAQAAEELMRSSRPPTAIIAVNDSIALGAFEALAKLGLRVPEDVALAGFDGVQLAASPMFNLTTVDQQIDQLGRRATRLLLRQLAGTAAAPAHEILATRLLVRRSTDAPPRRRLAGVRRQRPGAEPTGVLSIELVSSSELQGLAR
jgi:DNA-binding LacI/PurR family transcriptional regulator